ncbi:hypothetical protein HY091_00065 [Candidatus Kaiserbacteria bacterium]|nr:hypothetical protein [Candidatus Kaiserbacteria bacterium]
MAENKLNIVQAEFFPPQGVRKTSIRFFDEHGLITKLVLDFSHAENIYEQACAELKACLAGHAAESAGVDAANSSRKMSALREQAKSLVVGQLGAIVKGSKQVAVEESYSAPLRMAKPEELPDLLQTAKNARAVWLFVFKPNDLLADKNESIGSIN